MMLSAEQLFGIKDERANQLHGFEDIKPMYLDVPPEEVKTFRQLEDSEKRRQGPEFYKQEFVQEYINSKWDVERHNRDCLLRLIELRDQVLESERMKVKQKIIEFCRVIAGYDHPFKSLFIDVSKYIHDYEKQEDLQEVEWDD